MPGVLGALVACQESEGGHRLRLRLLPALRPAAPLHPQGVPRGILGRVRLACGREGEGPPVAGREVALAQGHAAGLPFLGLGLPRHALHTSTQLASISQSGR